MNVKSPKVSVLMPVYNGEQYLRESIESILNQTFRDFEFLIISEHGTSAESLAIIESYTDERIRHIHNTIRLGLVGSLNLGLKETQGEYIARMDADDVSFLERLGKQIQFLDKHPEIGMIGTWFELIDEHGKPINKVHFPVANNLVKWHLFFYNPIVHPSVMLRRTIYEQFGGYDTKALHCEDYELWLRLAQKIQIANLPEVLIQLRKHVQNISYKHTQTQLETANIFAARAISVALGKQIPPERVRALREPQSITTAQEALDTAILLHHISVVYIDKNRISGSEREEILMDVAQRTHALATVCVRMSPLISIRLFKRAICLCPCLLFWFLFSTARSSIIYMRQTLLTGMN